MADAQKERNNYVSHADFVGADFDITATTATDVLTVLAAEFLSDNPLKFLLELSAVNYVDGDETYEVHVYTNGGVTLLDTRPILSQFLTETATTDVFEGDFSVTFFVPRSAIVTDIDIVVEPTAGTSVQITGRAKIVEGSE